MPNPRRDPRQIADDVFAGLDPDDVIHPLSIGTEVREVKIDTGLFWYEAFANVASIDTEDGLILIDAAGPLHAADVHRAIRERTQAPLDSAIFTHGHVDHIYAVALFEAEKNARRATVVGHRNMPARFQRYEATNGYNAVINQRQFQLPQPFFPGGYRYPDVTYQETAVLEVGDVSLQLFHDRGETDDATWVWWADRKVLFTGDLFIWASPNCGNPQKAPRYCDEWAAALRKMQRLGAEVLLPGHGLPIIGPDRVNMVLDDTATLLESIFAQTIESMNDGATLDDTVRAVVPPAELLERPWLHPIYDEPEFIVRNIWRLFGGWYDGNPSRLKPPHDDALAVEVASLSGGASTLAQRALDVAGTDPRLATTLIEWAGRAAPTDPEIHGIRARIFADRVDDESSLMAKGVYSWAERQSRDIATPDG